MAKFYRPTPERASRTHRIRLLLALVLLTTTVDFLITLLLTVPCIRSLYTRQNNVDHNIYLLETQITALQQQNSTLERELRLLKQDYLILNNIVQGQDFVAPKE